MIIKTTTSTIKLWIDRVVCYCALATAVWFVRGGVPAVCLMRVL